MNIVRGAGNIAGNIVDGTVNAVATVASVATGGLGGQSSGSGSFAKRHGSVDTKPNVVLKDKVTLTLKVSRTVVHIERCEYIDIGLYSLSLFLLLICLCHPTVHPGAVGPGDGLFSREERGDAQT
jgi:hypothetical protein